MRSGLGEGREIVFSLGYIQCHTARLVKAGIDRTSVRIEPCVRDRESAWQNDIEESQFSPPGRARAITTSILHVPHVGKQSDPCKSPSFLNQ